MGTSTLSIQIWGYGSRTATVDDLYNIVKKNPELLSSISPELDFSDNTPKVGTTRYRYGTVYGVDENYIESKGYTLAKGRNIQYMDIADNKQICVIGDYINRTAYGGNAVGQTIKLGAYKFRIVGVLKAKISNPDQQEGSDDDAVYLPYTTAMRLSNASPQQRDAGDAGEDDDDHVDHLVHLFQPLAGAVDIVGTVALEDVIQPLLHRSLGLVGNIMLVSVTERTREIGIRKAMGAKERTILAQFVTEAATTSALGGTLGIILGYIVSAIANQVLPMFTDGMDVTVSPSFNSIAAAFGISVFIGVLFGYLPAKRAARLNPIDALRMTNLSVCAKGADTSPTRGEALAFRKA